MHQNIHNGINNNKGERRALKVFEEKKIAKLFQSYYK